MFVTASDPEGSEPGHTAISLSLEQVDQPALFVNTQVKHYSLSIESQRQIFWVVGSCVGLPRAAAIAASGWYSHPLPASRCDPCPEDRTLDLITDLVERVHQCLDPDLVYFSHKLTNGFLCLWACWVLCYRA